LIFSPQAHPGTIKSAIFRTDTKLLKVEDQKKLAEYISQEILTGLMEKDIAHTGISSLISICCNSLYNYIANNFLHSMVSDLSSQGLKKLLHISINSVDKVIKTWTGTIKVGTRIGNFLFSVTPRETGAVSYGTYLESSFQYPKAKMTITSGNQTICENQTLHLTVSAGTVASISYSAARSTDSDGTIVDYKWQVDGQEVGTSRNINFNLGAATHQIFLTVTDNDGNHNSIGATIIVTEQSTLRPPQAKITITSGRLTIREAQTLNLTVSHGQVAEIHYSASRSTDDGSIVGYKWQVNGTPVGNTCDLRFDLGVGHHDIFLTVTDNEGKTGSIGATVEITEQVAPNSPPQAKITITSGSRTIHEDQTLNLTVSHGQVAEIHYSASRSTDDGSIVGYKWQVNGTPVGSMCDLRFDLGIGHHDIFLTVTDNEGKTGSIGATVVITEQSNPG